MAGWLGSYGGEDSTSDISRGLFAGSIGVRRLLKLFDKYNIKTTFFIPGHSLETFPEECRLVADAGHEIGLHGYSHENPRSMSLEQQTAVMNKVDIYVLNERVNRLLTYNTVLSSDKGISKWEATTRHRSAMVGVLSRRRGADVEIRTGIRSQLLPPRLSMLLLTYRR